MSELIRRLPYRIETERLVLRPWAPEDARELRRFMDRSHEHLTPWIPFVKGEPKRIEETAQWLREKRSAFDRDESYRHAVRLGGEAGEIIGEADIFPDRQGSNAHEIGYLLGAGHTGRGYAFEAAAALVRVCFEVHAVDRIDIVCVPENGPSAALARKLGFTHEATLRRRLVDAEDTVRDAMMWSLFRDAYAGSPSARVGLTAYDCIGDRIL